jgi:hypothetical protein
MTTLLINQLYRLQFNSTGQVINWLNWLGVSQAPMTKQWLSKNGTLLDIQIIDCSIPITETTTVENYLQSI